MCQCSARSLPESCALRPFRHGVVGEGRLVAGLDVLQDLLRPLHRRIGDDLGLQRTSSNAADDREEYFGLSGNPQRG